MAVTRFSDFTLDLAGLVQVGETGQIALNALPTRALLDGLRPRRWRRPGRRLGRVPR
jgi:hypothetical protein